MLQSSGTYAATASKSATGPQLFFDGQLKILELRPLTPNMAGKDTTRAAQRRAPRTKKKRARPRAELDQNKVERLRRALDEGKLGIDFNRLVDSLAHAMRNNSESNNGTP